MSVLFLSTPNRYDTRERRPQSGVFCYLEPLPFRTNPNIGRPATYDGHALMSVAGNAEEEVRYGCGGVIFRDNRWCSATFREDERSRATFRRVSG